MPSIKKCITILICLVMVFACLLGPFSIIDSSSFWAKQNEISLSSTSQSDAFIISPTELPSS